MAMAAVDSIKAHRASESWAETAPRSAAQASSKTKVHGHRMAGNKRAVQELASQKQQKNREDNKREEKAVRCKAHLNVMRIRISIAQRKSEGMPTRLLKTDS